MIRNTKSGKGKPVIDPERKRGFGEVDLNALLTVDPTQYKDVNPILEYQMKAAAQYPDLKDWYTQDCKTNPDGVGTARIMSRVRPAHRAGVRASAGGVEEGGAVPFRWRLRLHAILRDEHRRWFDQ